MPRASDRRTDSHSLSLGTATRSLGSGEESGAPVAASSHPRLGPPLACLF